MAHFMPLGEHKLQTVKPGADLEPEVGMANVRRILVVDDEPSIGKALKMGLSSNEVEVDVAESGSTGVELGTRQHYDVLIADLCLPDIDGLEVIEKIRSCWPEIVSIIITGNPSRLTSMEATNQGIKGYLEKPLDMKSLRNAIKRGLEERELERLESLKG
jgi:two-component system response regulator YesN